ncbi:hypothetical protein M406DRAFT_237374, partial [Cryphonectria parasitica EP155]
DPRSSSTHSLVPSFHGDDDRRTLLVVYIHGFMGDNTSFQSFPAHVHAYLKAMLAGSHVIHTKIYPRYKTYKAIDIARDNFSRWLEPHESETTDVVLVGHSMGGLLAADVALMPSLNPVYGHPLKHRILGTVSLDAPLLGLHPGIIKSGIASLFRKAPDPPGKGQDPAEGLASQNASGSMSTLSFSTDGASSSGMISTTPLTATSSDSTRPDPTYNPPFFNDVQFVDRGWWRNVAHFAKKHYSEGLFSSTYQHLLSHLEFGACLADYSALNSRYNRLRQLEDVDELNSGGQGAQRKARVRFINYYTVSTGIPKKPLPTPKRAQTHLRPELPEFQQSTHNSSGASTPRISIEDYSDGERPQTMQLLDPVPEPDSEPEQATEATGPAPTEDDSKGKTIAFAADDPNNDLPAIPALPEPPEVPDLERYTDKDARKQAEKEYKRLQKTYNTALKDREKALKERQKLVEKRRKKAQKDAEKRHKEEEKRRKEEAKRLAKEQEGQDEAGQVASQAQAQALQRQLTELALRDELPGDGGGSRKLHKFCMVPPKTKSGVRDSCWVQVYMEGVDEVGAHCGLFFPGPHYEKLVGDVGSRIVGWVHDDMSLRAI